MSISRRDFLKTGLAAGAALAVAAPVESFAKSGKSIKFKKKAKRVLVIAFDGIRVDGLTQANTPNIDSLIKNGAASMATRDVMPSITLPNFTSIFTGAGPEVHGVDTNSWKLDKIKLPAVETDADGYFPSVFKVLKEGVPGIKTAYFWNWKQLINSINKKYLDKTLYAQDDAYIPLYEEAFNFLKENRDTPTMTFLYTVHTDHTGHKHSWMSPEYIKSIEEGDEQIGILFDRLRKENLFEDMHIMFISDHGGIKKGHGGVSPEEMIVPWIIQGPGIKTGFTIEEPNNTVNTASTILHLFGVEQPLCWTGEVPYSIFK